MKRDSFLLFTDSLCVLEELTDEQKGQLFYAIYKYNLGEEIELNPVIKIAFSQFKNLFNRNNEKYKKTVEARRVAGSKGGKQKVANASKSKHEVANLAVPVPDPGIVPVPESEYLKNFDIFRKKYLGTKRGNETEFENFKKKHKDWKTVLPKLSTIIDNQIEVRKKLEAAETFVAEWKHLSTWVNNRCWEDEYETVDETPKLSKQEEQELRFNREKGGRR